MLSPFALNSRYGHVNQVLLIHGRLAVDFLFLPAFFARFSMQKLNKDKQFI